jgi:TonB-linked SusC/RagA family outer membrane protein
MKRTFTRAIVLNFIFLLLASFSSQAQQRPVSGIVTDGADKTPLPGVGVLVKGTQTGTTTDASGRYALNVPANATLVFSYIGYTTREVALNDQTTVNIALAETAQDLEAVVVVGYGTQRRRDLTGSISSVNGETLAQMPATNPIASLQGKVAGLTVTNSGAAGASPTVRIRGVNSTNSANPIYVVDGIIQDNIDYLNPGDIETIDLLRDPSSIAIYGLRGANGVIAVTTRRAARGKTSISLQSITGIQHVVKKIDVVDAEGFKRLYSAQLANAGAAAFDFSNYTANTDWQDLILRDAATTNNTLTISNSGEKNSTLLSLGYSNQAGVVKYDNYQKFIARLNEEINLTDKIKVGGNLTGFHWRSNPANTGLLNNALWAAPIVPVQEGDMYYSLPSFQRVQVGNPVASLNQNNRTSVNRGYRFTGSLFAEIKFLENFTWRSSVYTDLSFNNTRGYTPLPFTIINIGENGGATTNYTDPTARTGVRQNAEEFRRYQQDHTLTYDKQLDGGHHITAVAGFTTLYNSQTLLGGSRTDSTLNVPNAPDYWYLGIVNENNIINNSGTGSEESNVGGFARLSYAYENKYLLNATIRRDGSSKFAPENRWGTFGSIGLGWVISEEEFFSKAVKSINFLKIRAAWGRLGNSNIGGNNLYQAGLTTSSTAVFGENVYGAVQPAYTPDPNLHFEIVQGTDIGLDIRALDNRLNTELNVYNKTTEGILTSYPLPGGLPPYFTNLGKITNKGIEANVSWNAKIGDDLTYGLSANFSYNQNTVNSIGNATNFQILGNGGINVTESGRSIGYFYGYRQVGIYQSEADIASRPSMTTSLPGDIAYEDTSGDGAITTADRTYLGTPFPPYSYGAGISLSYKGFDASVEGQGVAGNKIFTQRRTATFAVLNYESNRLNAWTGPGTSNIEPILSSRANNYQFSSYFLESGNYFRLRTVQLGYNFKSEAFSKIGIQKMRLYLSGQNVWTWTRATGYSPEAQIGNITAGGSDNGVYPVPAVYSLGLNVTF